MTTIKHVWEFLVSTWQSLYATIKGWIPAADSQPAPEKPAATSTAAARKKQAYYEDMGFYETHPEKLKAMLRDPAIRARMVAFLKTADYAEMVSHYSDDALEAVREYGTELAFSKSIAKGINRAVQTEWGIRNPTTAPGAHGMGAGGGQK